MADFRLIVRRGPQPNQVYELTKDIVTIGRDITNDIVISDPEVSRHHMRMTRSGSGYAVEDLNSTNGIFVNGQRVTSPQPMNNGDLLGIGETVTLAYEAPGGVGQSAATMVGQSQSPVPPSAQPAAAPPPTPRPAAAPPMAMEGEEEGAPMSRRNMILFGCGGALLLVCCVLAGLLVFGNFWCDVPVANQIGVLCALP